MALQLPPPPRDHRVPLPPAPANPPTSDDIYQARRYTTLILQSKRKFIIHLASAVLTILCHLGSDVPTCATIDDVAQAILYESSAAQIASAAAVGPAVAPPWFAPVQLLLNNMQQQLNNMQQQLNRIETKASRALNATNEDGTIFPFEIVPFLNGTDPTAPPHNLPALTSTTIIDALSGLEATNYLTGYGIAVPHLIVDRHHILKAYLGCRPV